MTAAVRVVVRRFALSRRYATASLEAEVRDVAIVGVFDGDELVGVGEAAPLPGYATESLDASIAALRGFDVAQLRSALDAGDLASARAATRSLPGSARAAIEAAQLDALARSRGLPFSSWFDAPPRAPLSPASLVDLATPAASTDAGQPAFKLKIGRDLAPALARARELRERFPSSEIRLDANRSLDPVRDGATLARFAEVGVSFVEEPFASLADSLAWSSPKVALDESLRGLSDDAIRSLASSPNLVSLVLKPTSLGVLTVAAWADVARRAGRRAIVSHCFEGPIGFEVNAALAFAAGEPNPGLDPDYGPIDAGVRPPCLADGGLVATGRLGLGLVEEVRGWF